MAMASCFYRKVRGRLCICASCLSYHLTAYIDTRVAVQSGRNSWSRIVTRLAFVFRYGTPHDDHCDAPDVASLSFRDPVVPRRSTSTHRPYQTWCQWI